MYRFITIDGVRDSDVGHCSQTEGLHSISECRANPHQSMRNACPKDYKAHGTDNGGNNNQREAIFWPTLCAWLGEAVGNMINQFARGKISCESPDKA